MEDDFLEDQDVSLDDGLSTAELLAAGMMVLDDDEQCACRRCACVRSRTAGNLLCADCLDGVHAS